MYVSESHLKIRASLFIPDSNGMTSLHKAAKEDDMKSYRSLMRYVGQKEYSALDSFGKTAHDYLLDAFHFRTTNYAKFDMIVRCIKSDESDKAFELIAEEGLEILTVIDDCQSSLLHYAAGYGSIELVVWLLTNDLGNIVNSLDILGETPLIKAVAQRRLEVALLLLYPSGRFNVMTQEMIDLCTDEGGTVLHWARRHKCKDIEEILLQVMSADGINAEFIEY